MGRKPENPTTISSGSTDSTTTDRQRTTRAKVAQQTIDSLIEGETNNPPVDASESVDPQAPLPFADFKKIFNAAYNEFYRNNSISEKTKELIDAQDVDIESFDRLTINKQHQRYISLLDGRIIFHEVPNAPHGEVSEKLNQIIWGQIDQTMFQGCSDNDCLLGTSKKRPDQSFRIRKSRIPNPRPAWLKLLPDNPYALPYPSIVVEVAVNDETPAILRAFAQRYFSTITSIRLWVAVKIWLAGQRFWVGWGERRPAGRGCRIHASMDWPPNAWSLTTPVNVVYQIPMATVYGPGIQIPVNAPATLDISVEEIRQEIIGVIM